MMKADALTNARQVFQLASRLQAEVTKSGFWPGVQKKNVPTSPSALGEIYTALLAISEPLARSYVQVKNDLKDETRCSWAGTAHEIRELLATLLREMAPDDAVASQPWYKQDSNTSGPTQKQRVRYIMEHQKAGSKQAEVVQEVGNIEEMICNVVRAMYSRASDAAHRFKDRREVNRIMRYFDTFAVDLLNLE